ncbi:MAG: hypothetical protein EOP48_22725 [Sphingobacteriales bacterium]|nr:MAG: hypothetical protein EOP48_22725 [Sphingobacteriales bacterium]
MNLDYFSIYAGTSSGLKKYIDEFDQKASMFFFRPIMVFKSFDEKGIYHFLKNQIESLIGNSKQELILKAMKNFDWCHDNPNIHDNVSYLVNGY